MKKIVLSLIVLMSLMGLKVNANKTVKIFYKDGTSTVYTAKHRDTCLYKQWPNGPYPPNGPYQGSDRWIICDDSFFYDSIDGSREDFAELLALIQNGHSSAYAGYYEWDSGQSIYLWADKIDDIKN